MRSEETAGSGTTATTAGERVQAILFTDVEGSTELRSRHGDVVADEVLAAHEAIVRRQIEEHGGREVSFLGDGFLASFPDSTSAVRCAVGIQRALDEHNHANPGRQVRVRIGLHAGEVTERDGTLYGQAVHAASRVMSEAAGGQILASELVHDEAVRDPGVSFLDRGLFWLKGFPERWRLYEAEWWSGASADHAPGPTPGTYTPFVGREDERADLRRAVHQALAGEGSLVLISGEPGVGKTRLVQEVDFEAAARGMRVLIGHCIEMEGATPYLPFVEILEQALVEPRSPQALRAALGDVAPEIARIVPGLRRVFPDIADPLDLPPEQARRYLWVSIQEFMERAARDRPLLLVLEDLHWADESTVLLLEHLAPSLRAMPVLIVGTYRDVEVGATHPLTRATTQLTRRRLVERVSLKRLPEDDVAAMIRGLAEQDPPPALVKAIYSESEGNPFFVEEVFLHLSESGKLLDDEGRFRKNLKVSEIDVPQTVRLVVGERLARLSEGTREVLAAAAASGRQFSLQVVERVAEVPADGLAEALDEAEHARLVGPAEGRGRMAFSHELIRQTLLADTSTVKRQRLHALTAVAIEEVFADDLEEHAADLAYHLSLAGPGADLARLVRYETVAADRAMQASAFEDALSHVEHALSLVPADGPEPRADLEERRALALRSLGRWDDALRAMDAALDAYEALGRADAMGRLCWVMSYHLAWAARFEEAVLVAGKGLAALGDLPNPDRARLMGAGGWIFGLGGDHATAEDMLRDAVELATSLGDGRALADVRHLETIHHMSYAEFPEGIEAGLLAAEVIEREGALWDLCSVLSFVEFQSGTLVPAEAGGVGDAALAPRLHERVRPLAERLGHLGALFLSMADICRRLAERAEFEELERTGLRILDICRRGGLPWLYVGHVYLGLTAHWRGDWEAAERELRLAVELEPPAAFAGQSAALLALHLVHAGKTDEALQLFESNRERLPAADRVNSLGAWNALLGFTDMLFLAGRREEAAAMAPLLQAAMDLGHEWITFDCRPIRTRQGLASAAAGRLDEAAAHFESALRAADLMGNRIEQAQVRAWWGQALLENGDAERARELLVDAAARFREIGMPTHAERAEALRARVSG